MTDHQARAQAQVRADALSVLRDLLGWTLTSARWAEVMDVLDGLGSGVDLADPVQLEKLAAVTSTLELAGPVRISRITTAASPVPGALRDRVNQLIDQLAVPGGEGQDDDPDGTARARAGQ
jgi:hypothetical protein